MPHDGLPERIAASAERRTFRHPQAMQAIVGAMNEGDFGARQTEGLDELPTPMRDLWRHRRCVEHTRAQSAVLHSRPAGAPNDRRSHQDGMRANPLRNRLDHDRTGEQQLLHHGQALRSTQFPHHRPIRTRLHPHVPIPAIKPLSRPHPIRHHGMGCCHPSGPPTGFTDHGMAGQEHRPTPRHWHIDDRTGQRSQPGVKARHPFHRDVSLVLGREGIVGELQTGGGHANQDAVEFNGTFVAQTAR